VSAVKAYDTFDFVEAACDLNVALYSEKNQSKRRSNLDPRATRHAGSATIAAPAMDRREERWLTQADQLSGPG
jgi:hypothetical protein